MFTILFAGTALANTPVGTYLSDLVPQSGSAGVPVDAHVVGIYGSDVGDDLDDLVADVTTGGTPVAGAVSADCMTEFGCASACLVRFIPDAPWASGAEVTARFTANGNDLASTTFTTGTEAVVEAGDAAPEVEIAAAIARVIGEDTYAPCLPTEHWILQVDVDVPFVDVSSLAWARLEIGPSGGPYQSRFAEWVGGSRRQVTGWVAEEQENCFQVVALDGVGRETPASVEACADWPESGTEVDDTATSDTDDSATTDPVEEDPKGDEAACAGCSSTPPSGLIGMAMGIAGLLRRRRSQSC